ncbi:MAG: phage shock protein operon transcriptional activator [Deferrisomatales bacterium]
MPDAVPTALAERRPAEAIGRSEAFVAFQERLSRAARVDRPVLLLGERGTGKELAAARLHYLSARWKEPFVTVHCAALSPTLIESELFGHEAGAFTGAAGRRAGRFEAAHGGTLFLDEVASVPLPAQEKILRAVEYGELERVGSSQTLRVDVRIVAAANADLRRLADRGGFRWDLLDRLSFEVIRVPPLRERREDILVLARHFAARFAAEIGRPEVPVLGEGVERALLAHDWPGNVRELKNAVERAVYAAESATVERLVLDPFEGAFPPREPEAGSPPPPTGPPEPGGRVSLPEAVERLKIRLVRQALEEARYNQRRAAELLGLTYHQFRGLYRKLGGRLGSGSSSGPGSGTLGG